MNATKPGHVRAVCPKCGVENSLSIDHTVLNLEVRCSKCRTPIGSWHDLSAREPAELRVIAD
jgi:hypothetical protein